MATFQVQVEGLTSLSVGTTPTAAELAEFLKDGVIDVTNRWLAMKPQDIEDFVRGSSTQSSNGFATSGANIVSVIREAGADGDTDGSTAWEPCRKVPSSMRSRVVDVDSLSYASKYNPVYILSEDGAVLVFPAPSSSSTQYKLYYVNGTPTDVTNGASLAYTHSDIKYFPENKVYLVVLYAACQSLLNALSAIAIGESIPSWNAPTGFVKPSFSAPSLADVSALTLPSVPVAPAAPSFSTPTIQAITVGTMPDIDSTTISNVGTPPSYTAPTVTGDGSELTSVDDLDTDNTIDVHADQIDFDQWFSTAAHLIEDEEDVELATAQLQKIKTYIEAYSTEMQNKLNTFNKEDKEYQAKLQEAIQQAQINAQKATQQAQIDASKVTTQAQLDATDAQLAAADISGDGIVNILDIVQIVYIILN